MEIERQSSQPSAESLQVIDACARELQPEGDALSSWHHTYVQNHRIRIAMDLDVVRGKVGRNLRVLEFGSVPLLLTLALAKSGYAVTGCDIAPERYTSTLRNTGLNVVKCDVEVDPLPFPENSFDAIVFNELFEHLRINPICTMTEVLRVLKPGGLLILSTPNLRSLRGIKNFVLHNRASSCSGGIYAEFGKLDRLGHMGHVREYTSAEVVEFLGDIGFRVNGIIYRGQVQTLVAKLLTRLFPGLSGNAIYLAAKPAQSGTSPAAPA